MNIILILLLLTACAEKAPEYDDASEKTSLHVSHIETSETESPQAVTEMRGIWVSQFDMKPIYRDGNTQREESDFRAKTEKLINNLVADRFNTVFLQVRPNGDSMVKSELFPMSKYIAGSYGGSIEYDAVRIFLDIAKSAGLSVHAWINPYRLCSESDMKSGGAGILFEWYKNDLGGRIKLGENGTLYLDPSYPEASELIADGAREILENYDFDGIHIDDYFYPTEFQPDDSREFEKSGMSDLGEFRRANTERTVQMLYWTVHEFEGKEFGISPAGNIYSLPNKWYIDIEKWCSEDGYADYILPQLYFGFDNAVCPFETILSDWTKAMTNKSTKLYIGLSAAKCANGTSGIADTYAGEKGRYEWRDNKDILSRSLSALRENGRVSGYCIFTYSSFYDPITGEGNALTDEERSAFISTVSSSYET